MWYHKWHTHVLLHSLGIPDFVRMNLGSFRCQE